MGMPWNGMVKKTIVEIFDHLDADSDDDITLSDMLRVMSATVTDAGIRGSFKTIDKAGTGHISKAEWKAHWKVQCQHPEHPNTQDLIKLRKQFGLESLLGEPNQDVSDVTENRPLDPSTHLLAVVRRQCPQEKGGGREEDKGFAGAQQQHRVCYDPPDSSASLSPRTLT